MKHYKLVDKVPVECSLEEYAQSFDRSNRSVARTALPDGRRVSTVFLSLDHRWVDEGPPILFESMLFGADDLNEQDMERYCTWDEAYEGHRNMVTKHGGTVTPEDFFEEELFEI